MHPLHNQSHPESVLCNIYTGQTSEQKVNVNKSVEIGQKQLQEFHSSLPDGFRSKIKKEVVTMKVTGEAKKKKLYNSEIIFSRVMYLLSADQIEIKDLFTYELAPVPTALFKETGEGRYPTSNAVLTDVQCCIVLYIGQRVVKY